MIDFSFVLAGAATGLLVGLTGVGGGALMTPLLYLFFGVMPLTAIGTDLWFAAITKIFGAGVHHRHRLIDWPVVKRLWMGSIPMSALTLAWMKWHVVDASTVNVLKYAISSAVVLTALGMVFQKPLHEIGRRFRTENSVKFKALQGPLTVIAGGFLGVMVTLTSIGAGAIGAVMLVYLYPFRLTPERLIATDIVHAIPLALFAGLGHLMFGDVNFKILINLLIGSIPAVVVGAILSSRLPSPVLKWALSFILAVVGLKVLLPTAH